MRDIGKNLKQLREQKGLKQEQLAELLFVTRQTVSNYENGRSRPDIETLMKIAEILETDVNHILYGPPVPEDRSEAIRSLLIAGSVAVIFFLLWFVCSWINGIYFLGSAFSSFLSTPVIGYMAEIVFCPALFFLAGWISMFTVGIYCKAQPLQYRWVKYVRRCLWSFLGVCAFVTLTYLIYFIMCLFGYDGAMFNYPFYLLRKIDMFISLYLNGQFAFLYFPFGELLWLFGFPKKKIKEGDAPCATSAKT